MATKTNLGKIGLTPKGVYNSALVYEILDVVSDAGNSYVSRIIENSEPLTNTDAWMLSAEKGVEGDKGDTFTFDDLTNTEKEQLKGDVIAYNSLTDADKLDLASRVPIVGAVELGNTQAVSGGEVYDELIKKADSSIINNINLFNEATHIFIDVNDNIVAYVSNDGDIFSAQFPAGLKVKTDEIETLKGKVLEFDLQKDLILFLDDDKNVIAKIDKDSNFWIVGLDKSIQDEIKDLKKGTSPINKNANIEFNKINDLNEINLSLLNKRASLGLNVFTPPYNLLRSSEVLPNNFIENLKAPLVETRVEIGMMNGASYNPDSGVVHPYVVEMPVQFLGYKYLMVITGYTNGIEDYEIPWLYGCKVDSLDSWELISTAPQPLDIDPDTTGTIYTSGHLSDCFIFYNPKQGELVVGWRRSLRIENVADKIDDAIYYRSTKDGINWTEIKELFPPTKRNVNSILSPTILYDEINDLFHLYYVHNSQIEHRTNKDYRKSNEWSATTIIARPVYLIPWHLEAKYVGNNIVLLIHQNLSEADNLFFASSTDFENFTFASTAVFSTSSPMYKSSFLPKLDETNNDLKMKIIYTTDERTTPTWQLKITETNIINI